MKKLNTNFNIKSSGFFRAFKSKSNKKNLIQNSQAQTPNPIEK